LDLLIKEVLMMINQDPIQSRLKQWLMRKTSDGSTRQVAQMPLVISSDIGNVRLENQDRVAVLRAQITPNRSFLVAVLGDGMGGMEDGAGCASLAVAAFLSSCIRNRDLDPTERIRAAVDHSNNTVNDEYHEKGGATLSAFLMDSDGCFVAINVGDSRIYSLTKNKLSQLSEDDTLAGQINNNESPSQLSNELLQFIGMGSDLEPHFISIANLASVSTLLMTSDGAHFVDNNTMASVIRYSDSPNIAAERLVYLAKWCGGKDNVSIIVAQNPLSILNTKVEETPPSGSVEIWDAYGEVQLIGVEKSGPSLSQRKTTENPSEPLPDTQLTKGLEKTAESKEPISEQKKGNQKKTKTKSRKRNIKNNDKPQIKIDFE
jgi:serine/threonine protein phosphatase PrpC